MPWETLGALVLLALGTAGLFAAAGDWGWPEGWAYLALLAVSLWLHRAYVARRNPVLAEHRQRVGQGTPRWDRIWLGFFWPLMLATPVTAALDSSRFKWLRLPLACWPLGALLLVAGLALSAWAMGANPFFEGTVRLQSDRGQYVVQKGPYRYLRHPGYLGLSLWALSSPLMLRSGAAFLPAALTVVWLVVRTALEDRFLKRELAGYAAYAQKVRWRLVIGLW